MRIVQIAPSIGPGSGVAGVAFHLEQEFRRAGVDAERFTLDEAGGPRLPLTGGSLAAKLGTAARVVWFSTIGTKRARRYLADRPDAVAICHNDVMVGDVYVNHGLLRAAMKARGWYIGRMLRNPLHLFTATRDWIRYGSDRHRVVVNLTAGELDLLRRTYPRLRPRPIVIPNGVDVERFRPPSSDERARARAQLRLSEAVTVAVFVGHEFDRKGLPIALEALRTTPNVLLLVVGGSSDMIRSARSVADALGVGNKVHFTGAVPDPRPLLHAADVFVLPSAYEANALVVLEALACGLPVISTRVGFAPDIIEDGSNGFLIERKAADLARRLAELDAADRGPWRERSRATAERFAWAAIAQQYLALATELTADRKLPHD